MINWIIFFNTVFFCSFVSCMHDGITLKPSEYDKHVSEEVNTDIKKNKYPDMLSFIDVVLEVDPFEEDTKKEYEQLPIHNRINPINYKDRYEYWKKYYCDKREQHRVQGAFTVFVGMTALLMGSWYWGY